MKIGWFSTGRDKAARDLLKVVRNIPEVKIEFVFCNRKYGESKETDLFLDLVRSYELPIIGWSSANFKPELRKSNLKQWREEYDRIATSFWAPTYKVDLCLLAGYMLICSPLTCQDFNIINLHPARPGGPKGTWQEVIRQLIDNKERESGAMIHLVTPELDAGQPLTYCTFPLDVPHKTDHLWRQWDLFHEEEIEEKLFNWIRKEGLKRECPLISETLRLLASGEIKMGEGSRDLTELINKKIRSRH